MHIFGISGKWKVKLCGTPPESAAAGEGERKKRIIKTRKRRNERE